MPKIKPSPKKMLFLYSMQSLFYKQDTRIDLDTKKALVELQPFFKKYEKLKQLPSYINKYKKNRAVVKELINALHQILKAVLIVNKTQAALYFHTVLDALIEPKNLGVYARDRLNMLSEAITDVFDPKLYPNSINLETFKNFLDELLNPETLHTKSINKIKLKYKETAALAAGLQAEELMDVLETASELTTASEHSFFNLTAEELSLSAKELSLGATALEEWRGLQRV